MLIKKVINIFANVYIIREVLAAMIIVSIDKISLLIVKKFRKLKDKLKNQKYRRQSHI